MEYSFRSIIEVQITEQNDSKRMNGEIKMLLRKFCKTILVEQIPL